MNGTFMAIGNESIIKTVYPLLIFNTILVNWLVVNECVRNFVRMLHEVISDVIKSFSRFFQNESYFDYSHSRLSNIWITMKSSYKKN